MDAPLPVSWRHIDLVTSPQLSLIIRNITFEISIMTSPVLRSTLAAALLAALPALAHPAPGPGPGNIQQARLVEGSCTLPGFPDDVVHADRALRQRIDFTIGVDGRVKDARVSQPSGFPDYDRAMVQALSQCSYIPALRDGKPMELRSSRETVRSAGAGGAKP